MNPIDNDWIPNAADVTERVNETGRALAYLVKDLTDRIKARNWEQEQLLAQVYNPLKAHIKSRVQSHASDLAIVSDVLRTDIRSRIADSALKLFQITGECSPEQIHGIATGELPLIVEYPGSAPRVINGTNNTTTALTARGGSGAGDGSGTDCPPPTYCPEGWEIVIDPVTGCQSCQPKPPTDLPCPPGTVLVYNAETGEFVCQPISPGGGGSGPGGPGPGGDDTTCLGTPPATGPGIPGGQPGNLGEGPGLGTPAGGTGPATFGVQPLVSTMGLMPGTGVQCGPCMKPLYDPATGNLVGCTPLEGCDPGTGGPVQPGPGDGGPIACPDNMSLGCAPVEGPLPPGSPCVVGGGCGPGNAVGELWGPTNPPRPGQSLNLYVNAIPANRQNYVKLAGPKLLPQLIRDDISQLPAGAVIGFYRPSDQTQSPPITCGACPPDTCPGQPPPPPPLPIQCGEDVFRGLPKFDPGLPAFCDHINDYLAAFTKLGMRVQEIIYTGSSIQKFIGDVIVMLSGVPFVGSGVKWIGTALLTNTVLLSEYWCRLLDYLGSNIVDKPAVTVGIWFTRTLFNDLAHQEVGIELGLKFTTETTVEWKTLLEILDYLENYAAGIEVPTATETLELYNQDVIDADTAKCFFRLQGFSNDMAANLIYVGRERPTMLEMVIDWRRHDRRDTILADRLRKYGMSLQTDREMQMRLKYETPTPSDLLGFARREVFRGDKLGVEEMAKEFEGEHGLRDLFAAGGIGRVYTAITEDKTLQPGKFNHILTVETDPDTGGMRGCWDIPMAHWLEHYTEVNPTQGFEFGHRLRPDRVRNFRTFVPNKTIDDLKPLAYGADLEESVDPPGVWITPQPWTSYDTLRLLRQLEYNPIERARLEAIAFRVLGRIQLRQMYASGTFGEPQGITGFTFTPEQHPIATGDAELELRQRYMDQGYTKEDSELQAYDTASRWEETRRSKLLTREKGVICKSYQTGILSQEEALARLKELLRNDKDAEDFIRFCDSERILKLATKGIGTVRQLFQRGEADEDEARTMLDQIGINAERKDEYLRIWKLELRAMGKQAQASQMCEWYSDGSISIDEMYSRLLKLRWGQADAKRVINHCQLGVLARSKAELNKLRKAQEKEDAKKRGAESETNIRRWLKKGIINSDAAAEMLGEKGWNPTDIAIWIRDAITPG